MKLIALIILGISIICCSDNNEYHIDGEIRNYSGNEDYIYLVKFYSNPLEVDSSKIVNGKFSFNGHIDFPEIYAIHYHPNRIKGIYEFYMEPGKLHLSIDEKDWVFGSKIEGSKITDLYDDIFRKYSTLIHELEQEKRELNDKKDSVRLDDISKKIDSVMIEAKESSLSYIQNNPASPITPYLLAYYYNSIALDTVDTLLNTLNEDLQKTSIIQTVREKYNIQVKYSKKSLRE